MQSLLSRAFMSNFLCDPSKQQPPPHCIAPLSLLDTCSHPQPAALESLLHILNLDLPSAHFLVRHMQSPPCWEEMYIHGLLHRIEGDYDNCRAWYADVCTCDSFTSFFTTSDTDLPPPLSFLASDLDALAGSPNEDEDPEASNSSSAPAKDATPGPRLMRTSHGGKVPSQASARAFISAIEALRKTSAKAADYASRKTELEKASRAEIETLMGFCADKFGTGKVEDASKVWVKMGEEHRAIGESMVSGGEGYRKF